MPIKSLSTALFLMLVTAVSAQNDVKDKFIAMLNGTESAAEKAVKTYCSNEIIENGMLPLGVKPVVTSKDGDCYHFTLTEDGEPNHYIICSEGDKITQFDWDLDAHEEEDEEE